MITGCGIISAIGVGKDAFTENFLARRSGHKRISGYAPGTLPFEEACHIPEFDAPTFLGPKGTRNMDRTSALAVAAAGLALQDSCLNIEGRHSRVGVVLGTSTGSIRSAWEFTQQTLVQARPYLVNPGVFPSTILNCAASQCAIWHKLKGPNATVAGGALSGLLALRYATICLRQGYADALLVGAVEEFCEPSAWGLFHTRSAESMRIQPPGEGCAFFVLERFTPQEGGRPVLAEVLDTEVGVSPQADTGAAKRDGLTACIHKAMHRAGVTPPEILAISKRGSSDCDLRRAEDEGLNAVLDGETPPQQFAIADLIGECFSASSAFQIAALLAAFRHAEDRNRRCGLVTSLTASGTAACSVIRNGRNE